MHVIPSARGGNGLRNEQAAGRAHTETHHEREGRDDPCPLARPARGLGLGGEQQACAAEVARARTEG